MKKFLTVKHNDEAGAVKVKEYRLACHEKRIPCIIITLHKDFANISCDNWLSTDDCLITVEGKMILEDQLQELQKKYTNTEILLSSSERKVGNVANHIPLWYNFTKVPLNIAEELAEKTFDIYLKAIQSNYV